MKRFAFILILISVLSGSWSVLAQDEPVTISFAHIFGGEQDGRGVVVQEIADAYMAEHPNVTIEIVSLATEYEELFNGALLAAEQGDAPTIVQVEESLTQLAADSGFFVPIQTVANEDQIASLDDLLSTVRGYYTIGGELYSVPWNASNPILYYNENMFTAAGLDPASPPTTFDEISAACEQIMAMEGAPPACINFPVTAWLPEQWMAMQNAVIVDNDNGRSARATAVNFNSPEMLNVFEWIKSLDDAGYLSYTGTPADYNGEAIAFLGGGSAMSINTTAGLTLIQQFSAAQGFELGVAPFPAPSADATNGVTVGGASLWVTAGHSDAETQAAVDFIFYLTNTENIIKWHQGSGYFPIRTSAIEQLTADGWFEANPDFAVAINQLQASAGNIATAGAVMGPASDVRNILVQAMQSVIDGGETPADALAAAQEQADAVLAEYNSFFE